MLRFARRPGVSCLVNFTAAPVAVPQSTEVLLASGPLTPRREVPQDTTVWLATRERS